VRRAELATRVTPFIRSTTAVIDHVGGFDRAVVLPAASCVCRQAAAVKPQLRAADCLVVVWNGRRPASHTCATTVLRDGMAVWIEFPTRLGAATARNYGVQWMNSGAHILAFADVDDVVHQNWLSELCAPLVAGEADLVGGVLEVVSGGRVRTITPGQDYWYRQAVFGGNCAITSEAWKLLGGFSAHVGTCEDTDLAWRAGELGLRVRVVPTAIVHYSLRQGIQEWRQRVVWGRSSVALLRAHGLALSRHLPSLPGLVRDKRVGGFASNALIAGLGQFVGQWWGRLFDTDAGFLGPLISQSKPSA
jgi:Glycosyltransferases, probably involved in cell wall biogenesis